MANKPIKSIKYPGLPDTYTFVQIGTGAGQAADAKVVGDEISDLKEDLSVVQDEIFLPTLITATATANGWRLNESDGLCSSNTGYMIVKYQVIAGQTLKIVSDDRFQFQSSSSVPSSGANNRVRDTTYGVGTFVLTVPDGATYLIFSTPTQNSNVATYKLDSAIEHINEDLNDLETDLYSNLGIVDINWFDSANKFNAYINSASVIKANAGDRLGWARLQPNTKYNLSITKKANTDFSLIFCDTVPAAEVTGVNKYDVASSATSVNYTFTTDATHIYIAFKYWATSATTYTEAEVLGSISITLIGSVKDQFEELENKFNNKFENISVFTCESAIKGKYINGSGSISVNASYAYIYIPYASGNIEISGATSNNGIISYWDEQKTTMLGNSGWTAINGIINESLVPSGTKYVALTFSVNDVNNIIVYGLKLADIASLVNRVASLENTPKKVMLDNARHIKGNTDSALTLLHFSDLHADVSALHRILTDSSVLSDNIDDAICTGDMVGNTYTQIASWWNSDVMTCMGNHDTASYSSDTGYNWTALSMADRDAYYIAPFESGWGITHTSGTSYYFKDYLTQKVRLIVMDVMLYNDNGAEATAQTAWLSSLLSDAITNNLHVLIAIHTAHGGATPKECSFSKYNEGTMPTYLDCNTPQTIIDIVATAIGNGLKFIGYICGHTHQDNIWDAENDGTQLMYCITCGAVSQEAQWKNSDQYRGVDADAYNLVTIDTAHTLVKIVRGGGADIDDHMRTRKAICFDYSTGQKVGEVL